MTDYSDFFNQLGVVFVAIVMVALIPTSITFFAVQMTVANAFFSAIGRTFLRLLVSILISALGIVPVMLAAALSGGSGEVKYFVLWWLGVFSLAAWSLLPALYVSVPSAILVTLIWAAAGIFAHSYGADYVRGYPFMPWLVATLIIVGACLTNRPGWLKK